MYTEFKIPKKSGGFRIIHAPCEELKEKQRQILEKLYNLTTPPFFCKGFVPGVNIVNNARVHQTKKYVLNVDIKDFFPSCKQKELPNVIRCLLNKEEIDMLFYNGSLPQGAPTSPYVANFYLEDADSTIFYLLKLNISDDILYTRYADDITVSSNSKAIFSEACLSIIQSVLNQYGFSLNLRKIHFMTPNRRKEVTGLCINAGYPTVSLKKRKIIRAAVHNYVTKGTGDLNQIKGWLAFLQGVPAHKEWAIKQLQKLKGVIYA